MKGINLKSSGCIFVACILSSCLGVLLPAHYKVENNKVYYFQPNEAGGSKILIKGADPSTIETLNDLYGKDKNYVYLLGNKVELYHAKTFKMLGKGFFKDQNSIYKYSTKIKGNPTTVSIINDNFYMDHLNVYFSGHIYSSNGEKQFVNVKASTVGNIIDLGGSEKLIAKIQKARKRKGWASIL